MIEERKSEVALKYINLCLSKYKDDGSLYYEKARALMLEKKYDEALSNLENSIALGFPLVSSYNLKAVIYGSYKNDYKMQKYFSSKAIEIDPTDYEAYLIRARASYFLDDYENSIKDFEIAYNLTNDDNILFEKTAVLLESGKIKEAIEILYNLNKKYPDDNSILYRLFLAYRDGGYYNNALYIINRLVDREKSSFYLKEKSKMLYTMGDYCSSALNYYSVVNSSSANADDFYFYSLLMYKNLKLKEALDYIKRAEKKKKDEKYLKLKEKIIKQMNK